MIHKELGQDLIQMGFRLEVTKSRIYSYYIIEDDDNSVSIEICLSNTDLYLALRCIHYDWNHMENHDINNFINVDIIEIEDIMKVVATMEGLFKV